MDEDVLMEKAAAEIETLQTVVDEVVIRVFGNDELNDLLDTKDEVTADEGQGRMQVLFQIEVPVSWDEKDIIKALNEMRASQMNKEAGVKIKSYSCKDLNIIIDVLKQIMIDRRELHHEVMPLISGFLSYIDTKEKANVNLKMIVPEKLQLEIGPAKKKVINEYSHTIECNISGKPSPFTIQWTKKKHGEEIAIMPLLEKYSGGTVEYPSLTIKCFMIDDEGIYVCRATNEAGVGVSNESQLTYLEKPMVKVSPEKQSVVRGKAQALMCSVSGIPQPIVLWMRVNNGEEAIINLSPEKYTGGNVDCPSLTIIDFNKKDEGIYVCKATNEAGEVISNTSTLRYIGELECFKDKYYS
ncbi:hemicentin-1-like [Mytilus californianus]|uniref:hemicentin-1-like n=1 Tax=Mytilus californianus TaxID=6549 RepID=UPI002246FA75|nr:hemicentin-1-like [Mytilus californianus]